jgi:DNA-binding GntR family transcriptional regulator
MSIEELQAPDRVTDATYHQLRQAVLDGALPPGTKLSVPSLATRLGVSPSPVREAVLRLIHDGLAVDLVRRGAVVRHLSACDLVSVYEVREVLEGLAGSLAAENCRPSDAKQLTALMDEHEAAVAAGDLHKHVDLDMRFHQALRTLAKNSELVEALANVHGKILVAMQSTVVSGGPSLAVADHRRICNAVVANDPDAAEQEIRRHIARLRTRLLEETSDVAGD